MASAGQRGPERGPDPPDTDDADVQASGSLGRVVRPRVSICEMHQENLSTRGPDERVAPGAPSRAGGPVRRSELSTEVSLEPDESIHSRERSASSAVHTPVHRCPHVINMCVHRPSHRSRKCVVAQRIQPRRHLPATHGTPAGKTFGQPLARLLATRIEISHAARSGARKPRATEAETFQERWRTARRPTGHGGRGNPVAVADDDAATRTDRAGAIAVRRVRKPACRWKSRRRTSYRAAREGVKAGTRRMWS